jgi:hypothetical protein
MKKSLMVFLIFVCLLVLTSCSLFFVKQDLVEPVRPGKKNYGPWSAQRVGFFFERWYDLDKDGRVDTYQASLVLRKGAEKSLVPIFEAKDMDGDGYVDIATMIKSKKEIRIKIRMFDIIANDLYELLKQKKQFFKFRTAFLYLVYCSVSGPASSSESSFFLTASRWIL